MRALFSCDPSPREQAERWYVDLNRELDAHECRRRLEIERRLRGMGFGDAVIDEILIEDRGCCRPLGDGEFFAEIAPLASKIWREMTT